MSTIRFNSIKLKPGMVFATKNPQGFGKPIRFMEKLWASDGKAEYGHTGIIQNELGLTLEALWTISEANLYQRYKGSKVLIAEFPHVTEYLKIVSIEKLKSEHLKQIYPFWRLFLHIVPPLARNISADGHYVVCSELVAKYEHFIDFRHDRYAGTNPDTLVDEWRRWRGVKIVAEGILV